MAFNPFLNWSREDLERELRTAQEDYASGSAITRAEAGDARAESSPNSSPIERIKAIYKALHEIDPDTYAIENIAAITTTRVTFWNIPNATVSQ